METPTADREPEQLMEDLRGKVGLEEVADQLDSYVRIVQAQRSGKLPIDFRCSPYLVFQGNPGTGKTMAAGIVANILTGIGVLSRGHVVAPRIADFAGQYVGQTAHLGQAKFMEALGGVLYLDDVHQYADDPHGKSVIHRLVVFVEDHRDDLVVILAGYTDAIEQFLAIDVGLKARLPIPIVFRDYTTPELVLILRQMVRPPVSIGEPALEKAKTYLETARRKKGQFWSNAKECGHLIDVAVTSALKRTSEPSLVIVESDIPEFS